MKGKYILIAAILTILNFISTGAQNTVENLTPERCVELTLQNNRQGKIARNNIDLAIELRHEALTKYFPEISAAGLVFRANHDILQYNLLDIIELGIINKGKIAGIQAMQPIFTGGQIINGNKLAKVGEEAARLREQQSDNELRLTSETLYWKLMTLQSSLEVLDKAIQTVDSLQNQVKLAVEAGLVTRNDLLKVELKGNEYKSERVDLENGIKLVKMLLGQYMGLGVNGNISIITDIPKEVPQVPSDIEIKGDEALLLTADYRLLEKNVEAKKLEKRMEIGKNLPSVAFGAGWYYHDLLEQNHDFGAIQIGVEVPLTAWWSGAYSIKRKNIEIINAQNELEDFSEKLLINIQDKWNNLTAAHRKMKIEAEGIEQSAENLYLNKMYYEAGLSTISDLLEAETSYKEAEDRYVKAYGDFRIATTDYLIATGR